MKGKIYRSESGDGKGRSLKTIRFGGRKDGGGPSEAAARSDISTINNIINFLNQNTLVPGRFTIILCKNRFWGEFFHLRCRILPGKRAERSDAAVRRTKTVTGFSRSSARGRDHPRTRGEAQDREGEKPQAPRIPGARNDYQRNRDRSDARGARGPGRQTEQVPDSPHRFIPRGGRRRRITRGAPLSEWCGTAGTVLEHRLESATDGSIACGRSMIG